MITGPVTGNPSDAPLTFVRLCRDQLGPWRISARVSLFLALQTGSWDFNAQYISRRERARHQQDEITVENHYKVYIFNAVINSQL